MYTYAKERKRTSDARKPSHHRRRTVGMVGNDPVMTLTPRIVDTRCCMRVYVCRDLLLPALTPLFLLPARVSPRREPPVGPKSPDDARRDLCFCVLNGGY